MSIDLIFVKKLFFNTALGFPIFVDFSRIFSCNRAAENP